MIEQTVGTFELENAIGIPATGYVAQGTAAITVGDGSMTIGTLQTCANCGAGFFGNIFYVAAYSTVLTQAQITAAQNAIEFRLRQQGIAIRPNPPQSPYYLIFDGDSITDNSGAWSILTTFQKYTMDILPITGYWQQLGAPGACIATNTCTISSTLTNLTAQAATKVDGLVKRLSQSSKTILQIWAGTNDLNWGAGAANTNTALKTYVTARKAAGWNKIIVGTLTARIAADTTRTATNATILTDWASGALAADAVSMHGFDPNMGQSTQGSTTWYYDGVHPSAAGNSLVATYEAPAIMMALGGGKVWLRFTVSNNAATNWTLAANGNTAGPAAAIAAATSQSVPLYFLGPKYQVCGVQLKANTAFTATGLTTLTATVGDSVGGSTFYTSTTYDLMAAPGNTNFQAKIPALAAASTYAGSNVTLELTGANQNLNAQANLAGSVDVRLCIQAIP